MIRSDCLCSAAPRRAASSIASVALVKMISWPGTHVLSEFGARLRCVRRLTSSAAWTLA